MRDLGLLFSSVRFVQHSLFFPTFHRLFLVLSLHQLRYIHAAFSLVLVDFQIDLVASRFPVTITSQSSFQLFVGAVQQRRNFAHASSCDSCTKSGISGVTQLFIFSACLFIKEIFSWYSFFMIFVSSETDSLLSSILLSSTLFSSTLLYSTLESGSLGTTSPGHSEYRLILDFSLLLPFFDSIFIHSP